MAHILKKPLAELDLIDIWGYVAENNVPKADELLGDLESGFRSISQSPGIGRHRPELAEGLHSFPLKYYVVFYRLINQGIEIVRVLHGARDIETIFQVPPYQN